MKTSLLEQYKIVMTMANDEWSRFYNRQSLYLGMQMIAFAGIVAGADILFENPFLFRLTLILLIFLSLMTALIATRGLTTQHLFAKIISELESRSGGELYILSLGLAKKRVTLAFSFILSLILAWGLFIVWVVLIIWVECRYCAL